MPPIIIVDTSVLLNVLDVPGFNQDRDAVLEEFGALFDAGANLLLPMGAFSRPAITLLTFPTVVSGEAAQRCSGLA